MTDLKFRIHATSENETKTLVKARNFSLIVDEPPALGGGDEGANPVEYLLAAYAGCINVVGHLIAKEMNFKLRNLKIDISGNLNPEKFMGKSDTERTGYKHIELKVKPDADAPADTLNEWLKQVCERCPVSDNIKHETPVEVILS